jgi:hypothetical protein
MALPTDNPASPDQPAATGKITHDSRGNAVWNWISESGKIAIDSTSRLLKRLDTSDLELEESDNAAAPQPGPAAAPGKPPPGLQGGYDPYSSRTPSRTRPAATSVRRAPQPRPAATSPARKPSFLARFFGRRPR